MSPDLQMSFEVARAIREFQNINEAAGLTDADKQQLKNAYLQNYFEPEARDLLKTKIAQRTQQNQHRRKVWADPHGAATAHLRRET